MPPSISLTFTERVPVHQIRLMKYSALATDYDGTLATKGVVGPQTISALESLKASGRTAILVTGRELPDLRVVFPRIDLFARVIAENGALLYRPATNKEVVLCEAPPPQFIAELKKRGVPLSVGRAIVATVEPHQAEVLEVIHDLGLELQITFNKGGVMILPSGVNKATGLMHALTELNIAAEQVVGIGDAENDHALLSACGLGAAVANAISTLKERADLVTIGARGAGVEEVIARIIADDLPAPHGVLRRSAEP